MLLKNLSSFSSSSDTGVREGKELFFSVKISYMTKETAHTEMLSSLNAVNSPVV